MGKDFVVSLHRIKEFIIAYYVENGIPPSRRVIMRAMGYKSPRSVDYFMESKAAAGQFRKHLGHYLPVGYKVVKQ